MRRLLLLVVLVLAACGPLQTILSRNIRALGSKPARVPNRLRTPLRPGEELAVLWIGHASMLIQIGDVVVLTDPVFSETVGQFSRRLVEPGLDPDDLPEVDVVAISHSHVDHLDYASLDLIAPRVRRLVTARGGLVYIPNFRFPTEEVAPWQTVEVAGLEITAVPVDHQGFRYGVDDAWMKGRGFTGWVFRRGGTSVYFGGDTAYRRELFVDARARLGPFDLAILPIGPIEPAAMARRNHLDPRQALDAFVDLGARHMVPMHFDTFPHGADAVGDAPRMLVEAARERTLDDRVHRLAIGEQRVFHSSTKELVR